MAKSSKKELVATARPLNLNSLKPAKGARHRRKRLGIGEGSGNGKTCGKGQKGQTSRSGFGLPRGFEGGQMPLYRRLPKVGFTSRKHVRGDNVYSPISLARLVGLAEKGEVTISAMREAGVIRSKSERIKILAGGDVKVKIVVEAHAVSAAAKAAIEAAGGSVKIIN